MKVTTFPSLLIPQWQLLVGTPGNLTAATEERQPEWFYIRQGQLYQVINSTAIYPVNIKNMTGTSDFPLQLLSSHKRSGNHGIWRWQGSMLFYEEGKLSNGGLFYECIVPGGKPGIFTFLRGLVDRRRGDDSCWLFVSRTRTPDPCSPVTLHAFNRLFLKNQAGVLSWKYIFLLIKTITMYLTIRYFTSQSTWECKRDEFMQFRSFYGLLDQSVSQQTQR